MTEEVKTVSVLAGLVNRVVSQQLAQSIIGIPPTQTVVLDKLQETIFVDVGYPNPLNGAINAVFNAALRHSGWNSIYELYGMLKQNNALPYSGHIPTASYI